MTLWMLWACAMSALVATAGLLGERLLRARGREGRWAWAASLVVAGTLQAWSLVTQARAPAPPTGRGSLDEALGGLPFVFVDGLEAAAVAAPALLERAEPYLIMAWMAASALLTVGLLGGLWRLRSQAKRWADLEIAEHDVLVSDDFGPALVGVWAPRIVLPQWALRLTPEALRITCLHEAEHKAARDTWLLFGGALLVALTPWNPLVWWQVSRLRTAVELDCDQRVLRTGVPRSVYGELLLQLGTRTQAFVAPVAALAQPISLLERRLTMMMTDVKRGGPLRTGGLVVAAVLLVIVACETPAPTVIQSPPDPEAEAVPATDLSAQSGKVGAIVSEVVGGGSLIRIRGGDSPARGQPLIYIDGVRIEGDGTDGRPTLFDMLDPTDIDRIEIIKGPAAEELYGSEAAGGVIQVFTKAGADAEAEDMIDRVDRILRTRLDKEPPIALVEVSSEVLEDVEVYIDDVLFEGEIDEIDTQLIESVEVVKSAAGPRVYVTLKKSGGEIGSSQPAAGN